jgi:hypothetical protein
MNGLLLFFILHRLLLLASQRRCDRWLQWETELTEIQRCIDARDYGLRSLRPLTALEGFESFFRQILAEGRFDPESWEGVLRLLGEWRDLEQDIARQAQVTLVRGLMTLSLALGVRLCLDAKWWMTGDIALLAAVTVYGGFLACAWKALPRPELLSQPLSFVQAWLLGLAPGPWYDDLTELRQREWEEGRLQDAARWRVLRRHWQEQREASRRRLDIHEDALGLWELSLALLLGCILWAEPLIDRLTSGL